MGHLLTDSGWAIAWDTTDMNMDLRLGLVREETWRLLEAWLTIARRLLVTHRWLLEPRLLETWLRIASHRRLLLVTLRREATHLLRERLRGTHHWLLHHGLLHHWLHHRLLHHGLLHHGLLHHGLHHRLLHHWLLELRVLLHRTD